MRIISNQLEFEKKHQIQ